MVPLLVIIGRGHAIVLTYMYDPSMGVTFVCTLTFDWHYRKLIFLFSGCEAERMLCQLFCCPSDIPQR